MSTTHRLRFAAIVALGCLLGWTTTRRLLAPCGSETRALSGGADSTKPKRSATSFEHERRCLSPPPADRRDHASAPSIPGGDGRGAGERRKSLEDALAALEARERQLTSRQRELEDEKITAERLQLSASSFLDSFILFSGPGGKEGPAKFLQSPEAAEIVTVVGGVFSDEQFNGLTQLFCERDRILHDVYQDAEAQIAKGADASAREALKKSCRARASERARKIQAKYRERLLDLLTDEQARRYRHWMGLDAE